MEYTSVQGKGRIACYFAPLRILLSLEGGTMMIIDEKSSIYLKWVERNLAMEPLQRYEVLERNMKDGGSETVCGISALY
jgi:hypothetical protein